MNEKSSPESGVALIAVLLVMMVMTVMMLGFYFVTTGEQKVAASDRDNAVAYYGAVSGIEKMSSDLHTYFVDHASVSPSEVDAAVSAKPVFPTSTTFAGISFSSYSVQCSAPASPGTFDPPPCAAVGSALGSTTGVIGGSGPLEGLTGIITPFQLTVVADGPNNTEVKMIRTVQEVAVPVFQFGIFSDSDLSFFAGPPFGFGGRVHTNGNLYLAEDGNTLTLNDHTTAFKDIIRQQLSNGYPTTGGSYGTTVDVLEATNGCGPGLPACRALGLTEGSVMGGPGSAPNSAWPALSKTTYNGWILSGATGAKRLNLSYALAVPGGSLVTMIQRPAATCPATCEAPASPVGSSRFMNQASLRILLSDNQADIDNLPAVDTSVQAYPLAEFGSAGWPATVQHTATSRSYYLPPVSGCAPPLAESKGYPADNDYMSAVNTTLLGGYIKIEIQLAATPGTWKDVTQEILSLGISRDEFGCAKNTSIVHLEEAAPGVTLNSSNWNNPMSYVPINMYDTREGEVRDISGPTSDSLNGVMNLVEIDVGNLQQWLAGKFGTSGTLAYPSPSSTTGYIIYTSDRRMNCNGTGPTESGCAGLSVGTETGEYGNEDIINRSVPAGTPNGSLDKPEEDLDGDGVFRTYGATPHPIAICPVGTCAGSPWPAFVSAMPATNPAFNRITASQAQKNSVVVFRRALRLVNGTLGNLPPFAAAKASPCSGGSAGGFTVASENPIYVQGDYNASVAVGFAGTGDASPLCHVPAALIGDAVTLLSNNWTPGAQSGFPSGDANSLQYPTGRSCGTPKERCASTTYYRFADIGGKNIPFLPPPPSWGRPDAGTDGGVHNFLRFDEYWGGSTLNYLGSMASFYFSRQATGIYKCCVTVYYPPKRAFTFDVDFQNISKLPPGTPRFSDVNALSYYQAVLANE